jgi:hypothetical protein
MDLRTSWYHLDDDVMTVAPPSIKRMHGVTRVCSNALAMKVLDVVWAVRLAHHCLDVCQLWTRRPVHPLHKRPEGVAAIRGAAVHLCLRSYI